MGNKLLTQAILIITSVTIILTYIKPAFTEIADIQDDISRYENTVTKAEQLNSALQELVAAERSISSQESKKLQTYLPSTIEDVLIMRDVQNIFKLVDIPITSLSSISGDSFQASVVQNGDSRRNLETEASSVVFRDFEVAFYGTYENLKLIIQGLEINAYPLEIVELNFSTTQDPDDSETDFGLPPGVTKYEMTLRAFALPGAG